MKRYAMTFKVRFDDLDAANEQGGGSETIHEEFEMSEAARLKAEQDLTDLITGWRRAYAESQGIDLDATPKRG